MSLVNFQPDTVYNFTPFVERTIEVIGWLYERAGHSQLALECRALEKVVNALRDPMCTKHNRSPSSALWKLAAGCFIRVLNIGLPLAREHPKYFQTFWPLLGTILEQFLFSE